MDDADTPIARALRESVVLPELTILPEGGDAASALNIVGAEDGIFFLEPDADGNHFAIAPFDVGADGVTRIAEGDVDEPLQDPDEAEEEEDDDNADGGIAPATAPAIDATTVPAQDPPSDPDHAQAHAGTDALAEPPASASARPEPPSATPAAAPGAPATSETPRAEAADVARDGPGISGVDAIQLNSTRVFLRNPALDKFYYADKAQNEIFCWNRATNDLRLVG